MSRSKGKEPWRFTDTPVVPPPAASVIAPRFKLPETSDKKMAIVSIYRANSVDGPWVEIPPEEHPKYIKDPDVMGKLVAGYMCQAPGSALWYRAERVENQHGR